MDFDKIELTEANKELLRTKQGEIVKVVEAIESLEKSQEWQVLKEMVFEPSSKNIERQLLNETMGKVIDTNNLYRLQGELAWAKQFTDTNRFVETLRQQLEGIKSKLK